MDWSGLSRRKITIAIAVYLIVAVLLIWKFHAVWFGHGTWAAGGNLVAWVLCGTAGFGWAAIQARAQHLAQIALADKHAADHAASAERRHQEQLAQAAQHHAAIKDHITAAVNAAPPNGTT